MKVENIQEMQNISNIEKYETADNMIYTIESTEDDQKYQYMFIKDKISQKKWYGKCCDHRKCQGKQGRKGLGD